MTQAFLATGPGESCRFGGESHWGHVGAAGREPSRRQPHPERVHWGRISGLGVVVAKAGTEAITVGSEAREGCKDEKTH